MGNHLPLHPLSRENGGRLKKLRGGEKKVARRFGGNRIKPLPSRPRRHREGDERSLRECHTTASSTSIGIERPTVVLRGDTVNE